MAKISYACRILDPSGASREVMPRRVRRGSIAAMPDRTASETGRNIIDVAHFLDSAQCIEETLRLVGTE